MTMNENDILGSFLPNIYIDQIILQDSSVELKYHIKETILSNGSFSITSFDILKKYILIKTHLIFQPENFGKDINSDNLMPEQSISLFDNNTISEQDSNGNRKILFTSKFNLNTNIEFFGLVIYSDLDKTKLLTELNIDIRSLSLPSNKVFEKVLVDNKPPETSDKFILSDGTEWYGDYQTTDQQNYYTKENPPRLVQKIEFKNRKIVDFRKSSKNEITLNIDNNSLEKPNNLNSLVSKDLITDFSFTSNFLNNLVLNQEIVADYFEIVDDNYNVSYLFFINFLNLIQKNTFNYNFINETNINEILSKTFLNNCRLYRKQKIDKNSNNTDYTLSQQRELVSSQFTEYVLFNAPPLANGLQIQPKKGFVIKDSTSNKINSGIYEYSIELEITNGTIEYLKQIVNFLYINEKNLDNYYNICVNPKYYNKETEFFNNDLNLVYEQLNIKSIVENFVDNLCKLNNVQDSFEIKQKYDTYVNPLTATPRTIEFVLISYKNLLRSMLRHSEIKINEDGTLTNSVSSEYGKINIEKTFKDLVDLNRQYEVKLKFIDIPDNNISHENITSAVERIKEQYGFNTLPNIASIVREQFYTTFPPKSISINSQEDIVNVNESRGTNYLDSVFSRITLTLDKKLQQKIDLFRNSGNSQAVNDVINFLNVSSFLEQHGVSIEDNNILPPQSRDSLQEESSRYPLTMQKTYNCITGLSKTINLQLDYIMELMNSPQATNQTFPALVIRGVSSLGNTDNDRSQEFFNFWTTGKNAILYRMLYDLQFLELINGQLVWTNLTTSIFNQFKNSGRTIAFRLTQNMNTTRYDTSKMKITKHFIVNF